MGSVNYEPEIIYGMYKQRKYVEYALNVYKNDLEADRSYLRGMITCSSPTCF
jgi:transposase